MAYKLLIFGALTLAHAARADLGEVVTLPTEPAPQEPAPLTVQAPEPTTPPATLTSVAAPTSESPVLRPWQLSTLAGPTAFVLDARQTEVGVPYDRMTGQMWIQSYSLVRAQASYGLTHSLMASLSGSLNTVEFGLKWNFLNSGLWSFSGGARLGTQFRRSNSYYSYDDNSSLQHPWGFSLVASRVLDDWNNLHFAIEYGHNTMGSSSSYTSNYNGSYYSDTSSYGTTLNLLRLTATYERRLHPMHGLNGWIAIEGDLGSTSYSYSSNRATYDYSYDEANKYLSPRVGVGYQFFWRGLGLGAGAEAGPSIERSYGWTDTDFTGAVMAHVSYRFL